ncbi:hypothetical protein RJ641_021669 [Dillenia turbinata]|uniref:Uncharacterized protein n=1 Tax=Dillenia turbinata TaxID=194707 RepID=A0AAN8UCJ7_9MAGN
MLRSSSITVPNVNVNLSNEFQSLVTHLADVKTDAEIHFYASYWSEIHQLILHAHGHDRDPSYNSNSSTLMWFYSFELSCLQCLSYPQGVVYLAARKYYFGAGGGTRWFLSVVERGQEKLLLLTEWIFSPGAMSASLVNEVADGSSNVQEVWKLSHKQRNSLNCIILIYLESAEAPH